MGTWTLDLPGIAVVILSAVLFLQGFVRLRRRGSGYATWMHAVLFGLGILVGLVAIVSPLDAGAEDSLALHMAQHLLLGDVMPMLLVLGVRGPLTVFLLPKPVLARLARVGVVVHIVSALLRPRVAFAFWFAATAAWHVPWAYDEAVAHPAVHAVEHLTFALGGVLVWTQIVDPARRRRLSEGGRAVFAATVLLAGMVLSEILIVSGPLYAHYADLAHRPFGWSAGEDQTRAGLMMMGEQIATLGMAAALLLWNHVERVGRELQTER
jgi:cytochrome c oxidase assembly factor CtaG